MFASSVSRTSLAGAVGLMSRISIGSPSASLTSRRSPSAAAQLLVEPVLEPGQAVAVGADVAEQLRGHPVARVVAAVLGDELQPGDARASAPRSARRGGDAARQVDEAGVAAGELAQDPVLGLAEHRGELARRVGRVLDQVRGRGDRLRRLGDGELDAVDVGDRAAPGGDVDVGLLLGRRGALERVGLDDAEPGGLAAPASTIMPRKTAKSRPMRRSTSPTANPARRTTPPAAGADVVVGVCGVTVCVARWS